MARNSKLKTALVTGASAGMGMAMAEKLMNDGLQVVAAARRIEKMQDLAAKGAHVIAMDVSDEASVEAGIAEINEKCGGVDVLVNNAGFGLYGAVEDIPLDDARYQFAVNVFGCAHLIQQCLPHMREQGAGKIINITSIGGKIYTPMGAWYHATKHAMEGFSDSLRLEVEPFGIDVVIVEPGLIRTEFGDVLTAPLKRYSAEGPYSELAGALIRGTEEAYDSTRGSDPKVIANVVSRAVKARRPKTRYHAGEMASAVLFMRRWLSDRTFDKLIMSQVKNA